MIIFGLNSRRENWLVVSVYKPPTQNATSFLNCLPQIINFYSITYEKQVIIGDFNVTPDNRSMRVFEDLCNLINLVKTTTRFKGTESCIDLLLTNQKYSFENTNCGSFGTSQF